MSAAEDSSQLTPISGGDGGSVEGQGHCSRESESLSSKKGAIDGAHSIVGLGDPKDGSLRLLTGSGCGRGFDLGPKVRGKNRPHSKVSDCFP